MKFFIVHRQPVQIHVYKRIGEHINVKTVEDGVYDGIWWDLTWMCNEKRGTTSTAWSKTRSFL